MDKHTWSDGIWEISNLIDVAGYALKIVSTDKQGKGNHGRGPSKSRLGMPRLIGPTIVDSSNLSEVKEPEWIEDGLYYQLFMPWKLGNFVFAGQDIHDWHENYTDEEPEEVRIRLVCCLLERCTHLPTNIAPSGPGIPYEVTIFLDSEEKLNRYSYYFTYDPETNRLHPVFYRALIHERVGYTRIEWKLDYLWQDQTYQILNKKYLTYGFVTASMAQVGNLIDTNWCFSAVKGNVTVNMILSPDIVKRLFKDRDKVEYVMTKGGKRRPIVHWVTSHHRKLKDKSAWYKRILNFILRRKKITTVKTHIRGLRVFEYNGLQCSVRIPGLHLPMISEVSGIITQFYKKLETRKCKYYVMDSGRIRGVHDFTISKKCISAGAGEPECYEGIEEGLKYKDIETMEDYVYENGVWVNQGRIKKTAA